MKRNLMLLTAVVLVAVMLSGCALWPFGKATVTWEGDADKVFTKLTKKVSRKEGTVFDAKYKADIDPGLVTIESTEVTWVPLKDSEEKEIGKTFKVEKSDDKLKEIKIKVTLGE